MIFEALLRMQQVNLWRTHYSKHFASWPRSTMRGLIRKFDIWSFSASWGQAPLKNQASTQLPPSSVRTVHCSPPPVSSKVDQPLAHLWRLWCCLSFHWVAPRPFRGGDNHSAICKTTSSGHRKDKEREWKRTVTYCGCPHRQDGSL